MIRFLIAAIVAAMFSFNVAAQPAPHTIEMQVDGLVCAFCAQGISKRIGKMDASAEVFVNLESGLVAVALKPEQDLDDASLREALTEAGYTVRTIQRTGHSLEQIRARLKAGS